MAVKKPVGKRLPTIGLAFGYVSLACAHVLADGYTGWSPEKAVALRLLDFAGGIGIASGAGFLLVAIPTVKRLNRTTMACVVGLVLSGLLVWASESYLMI